MNTNFTLNEVGILFEFAIQNRQSDAAGLALKVAHETNASSYICLSKAVENSTLYQFAIANGLAQFARYGQVNLIIELLQNKSSKVKLAAIACLEVLKDPSALVQLNKLIHETESEDITERAKIAFLKISQNPVSIQNNTFYTYKELTPLQDVDLAYAEFILNRKFSNTDVTVLVKLLHHPVKELSNSAEKNLLQQGNQIANSVFKVISDTNAPVTKELITVLSNYNDPRGAHLIIEWLNTKNGYEDYGAIEALGKIGGKEAAIYLAQIIVNNSYHYREIEALRKINIPPTSYLLSEYEANDKFRRSGAEILVKILGTDALQALLSGIQDRYREVRKNAEFGLTELGEKAIEPLLILLNSSKDDDIKLHICRTLGNIGDNRALTILNELTLSQNRYLHLVAVESIGKIVDPLSVQILLHLIESNDFTTRKLAIRGLGLQRNSAAIDALLKEANDSNAEIRLAAISSLYQLANNLEDSRSRITRILLLLLEDKTKEVADFVEKTLIDLGSWHKVMKEEINKARKNATNQLRTEKLYSQIVKRISEREDRNVVLACAAPQPVPPLTTDIPQPITDAIQFSVSAPRIVSVDSSFILDVWAYFDRFSTEIYDLARAAQRDRAIMLRSKGPVKVQRDTTLTVKISLPDFKIMEEDNIYWGGTTGNCTFAIKVPKKVVDGFHIGTANFYIGPLLIAKLSFDIEVGQQQKDEADITTKEQKIKTAFASYASDDRNRVLGRIQGMLKLLPELDIFLDIASLRSGDNWESRLEKEINMRDVFYLFWSRAASKSPWVEKEWRTALYTKGINCIDPVPLESPQEVPPPPELSSLHFNEWTLAFQKW